uniref:Uncharacterized protein n=1 Tax=Arundo donax TaxID=35708 RepID=A0A0A9CQS8_ARUDO
MRLHCAEELKMHKILYFYQTTAQACIKEERPCLWIPHSNANNKVVRTQQRAELTKLCHRFCVSNWENSHSEKGEKARTCL